LRVLTYIAVFLFAVLQYRLWLGEGSVQDVWDLRKQVDTARIHTQTLVERNRALYAEVNDLKDGLEAVFSGSWRARRWASGPAPCSRSRYWRANRRAKPRL